MFILRQAVSVPRGWLAKSNSVLFRQRGVATLLSGKELSAEILEQIKEEVSSIRSVHKDFCPTLAILQVGSREDSNVYIRMKIKTAEKVGMKTDHHVMPSSTTQEALLSKIQSYNTDPTVHGLIVQLPLDTTEKIDSTLVTESVSVTKDVDGMSSASQGHLAVGHLNSGFISCTPNGCMELIKKSGIKIAGANAVVLGRSKIVGTPMAELLKWHHATVTICHSKTRDLPGIIRNADIFVAAAGVPHMVQADWIKEGAVVIDCGINAIKDDTKKSGQRLVGDVEFSGAKDVAGFITPVPGGVGPMTVTMLLKNTLIAAKRAYNVQE